MEQILTIYDDAVPLHAKLALPEDGKETHPLVILLHGFTGDMEEAHIAAMARMMTELGFAVLRADLYGHGKSGGTFRDHTLYKWLSNILRLIDWAREKRVFSKILLCGHSQGGLAVLLAAAMERDRIAGVIALAPAVTIPERARKGTVLGLIFDPEKVPEEFEVWDDVLSGNYVRVAQTVHVEDALRYKGPVLFVHGDADETIPAAASVKMAPQFQNAELVVIKGDSHCYDYHLDEAVAAAREWLRVGFSAALTAES